MKNFIIAIALMFSATLFAQTSQGTWTFGVGHDFTTSDNTANASYFVMDGIMVSLEFHMKTDSGNGEHGDDANTDWGIGARYYIGDDGLWAGANVNSANSTEMLDDGHIVNDEDGMDMSLAVGCSKELMDNIWFEPYFGLKMPFASEMDGIMMETDEMHLGIGMEFRFAF